MVQNRFHSDTGYDQELREYCSEKGIQYQCFGVLKSNPRLLSSEIVCRLAQEARTTPEAAFYYLVLNLGNLSILNGTKDPNTMKSDLKFIGKLKSWASEPENANATSEVYQPAFTSLLRESGNLQNTAT